MKLPFSLLTVSLLLSTAAHASIQCQADIAPGMTAKIQIQDDKLTKVSGSVDLTGAVPFQFQGVHVDDFVIHTKPHKNINRGEEVVGILFVYDKDEMKSINPNDVASARLFDLGDPDLSDNDYINEMGRSTLVELRDGNGELLGRFLIGALIIESCK